MGKHERIALIAPRERLLLFIAGILLLVLFFMQQVGDRAPISSAETRFVEKSLGGLQIVPASCASVPPNPHNGGSCSGNGGCNISFSPDPVALGQSSTVFWNAPSGGSSYTLSYPGGSNPVSNAGSGAVGGESSKTYTLSYRAVSDSGAGSEGGAGNTVSCSAILTVCPAGQTVQNGQCVPTTNQCPSGQHLSGSSCLCDNTNQSPVNGQCINSGKSCSMYWSPSAVVQGQTSTLFWTIAHPGTLYYPGGSFPVSTSGSGPADGGSQSMTYRFVDGTNGDQCSATLTVCPTGQTVQNGQCAPVQQCTPSYFCQGNDLYQKTAQCNNQFVQACAWGCSGGACLPPPAPIAAITASPSLLHVEDTSVISWTSSNTRSCNVTATNYDAWSGTSGTETSKPIVAQTVYTLTCLGVDGSTIMRRVIINIIPNFQET
ncbi:hypothetical protein HY968_02020 [Candidatus Kaiserbacteria bacterium]|nr:hypothetical protein [Candidatus Kaiserbacteria bacterium]